MFKQSGAVEYMKKAGVFHGPSSKSKHNDGYISFSVEDAKENIKGISGKLIYEFMSDKK